jgi:CMP-N-acetylneuraminic acid synthetase
MSTIATICARGGSTGLPRKNVKALHGKPLIAHTIEQALACKQIEQVFVSTDDEEIADVARKHGAKVPFMRPAELATSLAPKLPVIQHLIEGVESMGIRVKRIVDLDPTSPLRLQSDIDTCIDLLDDQTDVVITGYSAEKNPYFNMVEAKPDGNIGLVKTIPGGVVARQQAPAVYAMNASIYVWHRHSFAKGLWNGRVKLHVMPRERSIDIDTPIDFKLVDMLMQEAIHA